VQGALGVELTLYTGSGERWGGSNEQKRLAVNGVSVIDVHRVLRGGLKAVELMAEVASRGAKPSGAGSREQRGEVTARPGSGGAVQGMELTCGVRVSTVGEREGRSGKRRNSEEKA
jgi:hypothetical protein